MSTMSRNLRSLVFFLLLGAAMVLGEDAANEAPPVAEETPVKKEEVVKPQEPAFNVEDHTDWGTYHDTQNIFCGKFDCYRILGFDYESFGKDIPDTKVITKRYRSLSREWHPDKSKHKDAKERFVVS
jgi:DnaJ family protein C protein 25